MMTRVLAWLATAAVLAAAPVRAEDPTKRGFDPDPARLALSIDGGFAVETAAVAPRGTLAVGAVLDLASGLAAMLDLRLPTGDAQAFTSDGLALVPSAVATREFGRIRLDAQLGYVLRG